MKIRDVIIGAVSSLAVTVLGGVAVYYATKEPDEKKSENLVFVLNQTAAFTGGAEEIAFSTLTITNEGGVAARKLAVSIGVKESDVRDLAINAQDGVREISRERTPKAVRIVFESLMPRESITVNLLLSQPERPTIDVRSEASRAEEHPFAAGDDKRSRQERLNTISKILVPVGAVLSALVWVFLVVRLRSRGAFDFFADRNDTGFLLLHHGLIEDADHVLGDAVRSGRSDQYTLSNYALCKALKGDNTQAQQLIDAANFRNRTGHGRAVVLFNEALIRLKQGDEPVALGKLTEAVRLSPKAIRRYCEKSVHFDVVRQSLAFHELINGA